MQFYVFSLESIKNVLLNCCNLRKTGSKYTASIHKPHQVMNIQRRFIHYIVTVYFLDEHLVMCSNQEGIIALCKTFFSTKGSSAKVRPSSPNSVAVVSFQRRLLYIRDVSNFGQWVYCSEQLIFLLFLTYLDNKLTDSTPRLSKTLLFQILNYTIDF